MIDKRAVSAKGSQVQEIIMSHSTATKDFAKLASAVLRVRQVRNQVFDADYFSDPAWDMVLTLRAKGPSSEAALVPACRIPASLLKRYCDILIKQEIVRIVDPAGPVYGLTPEAVAKLDRVFENMTLEISPANQ